MSTAKLVKKALAEGYAVPAFNIWNAETIEVVLKTAEKLQSPVILMTSTYELDLLSPKRYGSMAHEIAEDYDVPAALHLDHGSSMKQVDDCIKANYTSVMLDFSLKPFDENASALKEVVDKAKPKGITVEGEIGAIGQADQTAIEGAHESEFTDPQQARLYVEKTGVDILAISIGNAHGIYKTLPEFDFERLKNIKESTKIPLVLHGGSGTPVEHLQKAISLGITKVNIGTEFSRAYSDYMLSQWSEGKNLWVPIATVSALRKMAKVVKKWIKNLGSEGKA
ncbi:MAG: ketose-bisphosphate aldolase [Candidatus Hodarchaeota archaeon]